MGSLETSMGAGGSHAKESEKGQEWDFRMEVSAKLNQQLAAAVAEHQSRPAELQRALDAAQAEEARTLAREEEEMNKLKAMVANYNAESKTRTDVKPLACQEQRDKFLECCAHQSKDPMAC